MTRLFSCIALGFSAFVASADDTIRIQQLEDKLQITLNGDLFAEYQFSTNYSRPFFYPILGPTGGNMTRHWPMKEMPDEERDHPHHKGLWYTHGAVNGIDFWSESPRAGKTVHSKFLKIEEGKQGLVRCETLWKAPSGKQICRDERTYRFFSIPNARVLDFEIIIFAGEEPLVFGDTKEGTMAIRLAETMRLKGKVGKGTIINSEGVRDGATWGKRAKWVDYFGPVDEQIAGVAIFDHPSNPRHPTWWHVRDYGLFAANPFGVHDFEKAERGTGNLEVPAGGSLTFRYRFIFHKGDQEAANISSLYENYIGSTENRK